MSTGIEWCDETWNPVAGCSLESPGCTNCYAMRMAARLEAMGVEHYQGLTKRTKAGAVWTGTVREAPEHIMMQPYHWRTPRRVFVNSMSDLFHEDMPDSVIWRVVKVMCEVSQHEYQVLTKRSERMRDWFLRFMPDPPSNIRLGVSVEDRARKYRISHLQELAPRSTMVSAEPLLEHLWELDIAGIDWLIAGDESGPRARERGHEDAVRSLRDQCAAQGVAFFYKQRTVNGRTESLPLLDGVAHQAFPRPREMVSA